MTDPDLLFVYGTLRRGYDHPMAERLAVASDWIGAATVMGRLYRLDGYPGLVIDPKGGTVQGDLFRLHDPASLLSCLDEYEGCSLDVPAPQEYRRAVVNVDGSHGVVAAWTYIYNWPTDDAVLIADGRFTG